jgi:hypothetical protein
VDAAISRNNDKLTYDVMQDLKYMDMVVSGTARDSISYDCNDNHNHP